MTEIIDKYNTPNHQLIHLIVDAPREFHNTLSQSLSSYEGTKSHKLLDYVLAFEISKKTGKEHFHCTFTCNTPITTIKRHFKVLFGTKLNSCKLAKKTPSVYFYTVKDKDVIHCSYPSTYLKEWLEASYEKPVSNLKKSNDFYRSMKDAILNRTDIDFTERAIGHAILTYYHDKCKCFPFDRQLRQYIDSIRFAYLNSIVPRTKATDHLDDILDRILLN